jgi:pimeloyl-ACP methyl ester carboxylesterase
MGKGIIYRGEPFDLDEKARTSAPGQFVSLPDGMVHYEIGGPAGAQTVVLICGLSVPYFVWDYLFHSLVEHNFTVLRYDLYGRGYSDRPDAVYDEGLFDRQLKHLLESLKIDQPLDLVGWSLGGAISMIYADRHPDSVRRICLIDPAGLPFNQPLKARIAAVPIIGEWIMGLFGDKIMVSNLQDYLFAEKENNSLIKKFENQMQYAGFKRAILSTIRSGVIMGAADAYKRIGKREFPVLLIWGKEDLTVPFELSDRVRELIPNAEFHPIDKTVHLPHYERPEVVNPLVIEFLERQS